MDSDENLTEKFTRTQSILKLNEIQKKASDEESTSRRKSKRVSFSASVQLKVFEKASNFNNDDSSINRDISTLEESMVSLLYQKRTTNCDANQLDIVSMDIGNDTDINICEVDETTLNTNMTQSFMDASLRPSDNILENEVLKETQLEQSEAKIAKTKLLIDCNLDALAQDLNKEIDEKLKIKKMAVALLASKKDNLESILKTKQRTTQINNVLKLKNDEIHMKLKKNCGHPFDMFTDYSIEVKKKLQHTISENSDLRETFKDLSINYEILHNDFSSNFNKIKESRANIIEIDEYNKIVKTELSNLYEIVKLKQHAANADCVAISFFFDYIQIELDFSNIGFKNLLKDSSQFQNLTFQKLSYSSKIDDNSPDYLKFCLFLMERDVNAIFLIKNFKKISDCPKFCSFLKVFYAKSEDLANELLFCVEKYKHVDFDYKKLEAKFYYSNDKSAHNYFSIKFDSIMSFERSQSIDISLTIDDETHLNTQTYENSNLREYLLKAEDYLRTIELDV